jgi:hypothetical protein
MTGLLDGTYADSTLNAAIGGVGFVGVTQVTANVNPIGAFTGVDDSSPGSGAITETKSAAFSVGDGTVQLYTGDVAVRLEFGFGGENLDFQTILAQLAVSGAFIGPTTISIRHTVPAPATGAVRAGGVRGAQAQIAATSTIDITRMGAATVAAAPIRSGQRSPRRGLDRLQRLADACAVRPAGLGHVGPTAAALGADARGRRAHQRRRINALRQRRL